MYDVKELWGKKCDLDYELSLSSGLMRKYELFFRLFDGV